MKRYRLLFNNNEFDNKKKFILSNDNETRKVNNQSNKEDMNRKSKDHNLSISNSKNKYLKD